MEYRYRLATLSHFSYSKYIAIYYHLFNIFLVRTWEFRNDYVWTKNSMIYLI